MNKHELKKEFKDKIDYSFKRLDELENKKEELSGKAQDEVNEKVKALKAKKDELDQYYEKLENTSEEKLDEINVQFEKSLANFKQGVKEIQEVF